MPSTRFEHSSIKNKAKRQEIARESKRGEGKSRLAIAKAELQIPQRRMYVFLRLIAGAIDWTAFVG